MKTRSYLLYALCVIMQSCNMVDAQIIWLTNKNLDFTDCERQVRELKPFTSISNTVPFDVIYEQSSVQSVVVEGDAEYFDRLHTDVSKGCLEITMDRGRYRNVRLRIKISTPDIESIRLAGSGDLTCLTDIKTDNDLSLRVSGSGNITTQSIKCADFSTSVAGSGDMVTGDVECADMDVRIAGSGDFKASGVKADGMEVSVAGSGDIRIGLVNVKNTLSASVAGSGDISINGQANKLKARVVGSGDIKGKIVYEEISKVKSGSGDIEW